MPEALRTTHIPLQMNTNSSTFSYADPDADDGNLWQHLPNYSAHLTSGISATTYNDQLYVFYIRDHDNNATISYTIWKKNKHGQPVTDSIHNVPTDSIYTYDPAATSFNGKLYCFYVGKNRSLNYVTYDGDTWSPNNTLPHILLGSEPSVAVHKGILYVAFQGPERGEFYHMCLNGERWGEPIHTPYLALKGKPSLTVYKGELYCFSHHLNDDAMGYSLFHKGKWSTPSTLNYRMSDSPTTCSYNNRLYCAHLGAEPSYLWINSMIGGDWGIEKKIQNGLSVNTPCMTEYLGYLLCFTNRGGLLSTLIKIFQTLKNDIPLLDVWGEGRIEAQQIVTGFDEALNLNLNSQFVSNGVNRGCAIPNLVPVTDWDEPDFPINHECVQNITLMGAPITGRVSYEMCRVLKLDGRIYLYDPNENDLKTFETIASQQVEKIDTPDLPSPFNQINCGQVHVYKKIKNFSSIAMM